eukprot:g56695.t1
MERKKIFVIVTAVGVAAAMFMLRRAKKRTVVCVTGGTGYLGSWCVKLCLEKGYEVRVTTRKKEKAKYLLKLFEKQAEDGTLQVFEGCDLNEPASFDHAIRGCEAVLHTASPFYFQNGSEEKLVKPAVDGTVTVLNACNRLGVQKVCLTSSTAAVYADFGSKGLSHVYTGDDWSDPQVLRDNKLWYPLSKTLAEQTAWAHSKLPGCSYKLAVMCPTLIFGPMLPGQPHFNTSLSQLASLMDGTKKEIENSSKAMVDVRDVAEAHVSTIEQDLSWKGWGQRFVLIAACVHYEEVANYVRNGLPDAQRSKVPTRVSQKLGKAMFGPPPPHPVLFDCSPALSLLSARKFSGVEDMITSSVQSMLQNGFKHTNQYVPDK